MKRNRPWLATWTLLVLFGAIGLAPALVFGGEGNAEFTQDFFIEDCTFSTTGTNPFFIPLKTNAQLTLADDEEEVVITVTNKTKKVGGINTRVIQEMEWKEDLLIEVSRNFFAICNPTNAVFYFGEEVFICDSGIQGSYPNYYCSDPEEEVSNEGEWLAFEDAEEGGGFNMPGIMMPGTVLLGSRYFQEIAPGVAMDRAEHVVLNEEFDIDDYESNRCLLVEETTPLEPNARDEKVYCPGIGLVKDGSLVLIDYSGF